MTEFIPKLSPAAPIGIEPIEGFSLADGWQLSNAVTSLSAGYPQTAWTTDRNAPPCVYDPLIRAEGLVRIRAQIFPEPHSHGGWIFRVHHAGATEELAVPLPEGSESVIAALGEFPFTGDGTERVEILPISPGAMTRIGTLIFDIVNDRGGLWQTIAVTPGKFRRGLYFEGGDRLVLADTDSEIVHYLLVTGRASGVDETHFAPEAPLTAETFAEWIARNVPGYTSARTGTLAGADALAMLAGALALTGWSARYPALGEPELAPRGFDASAPMTRLAGAKLLREFVQSFLLSGPPKDRRWELSFHDEFDGAALDFDVWASDASFPGHIKSSRWPENLLVEDGMLKLLTKKESRGGAEWTTASTWVKPEVFAQTYGYWECRYRFTAAKGINNSFWMITRGLERVKSFEIDVNEGHYPNLIHTNLHSGITGVNVQDSKTTFYDYDLSAEFHTYGVLWTPTELIYYLDGDEIARKDAKNAHLPVTPILSTAVLNWAGQITDEADGTSMDVDWVRVWREV